MPSNIKCPITEADLRAELDRVEALIKPDTQDVSNMEREAGGTIKHNAGGLDFIIPLDKTETTLDDAAIPDAQHGLSAGQLALAYDSGGLTAVSVALWNSAKALAYSVSPRSIVSALYNSAVQGIVGPYGVRNPDGSLGFYRKTFINNTADWETAFNYNGPHIVYNIDIMGDSVIPFDMMEEGQTARIYFASGLGGADAYVCATIGAASGIIGLLRLSSNKNITLTAFQNVEVRKGEYWDVTKEGGKVRVMAGHFNKLSGVGWRENEDGVATIWGGFTLTNVLEEGYVAISPLPVAISNEGGLNVFYTDYVGGTAFPEGPLDLTTTSYANATCNFTNLQSQNTATTLATLSRYVENNAGPAQAGFIRYFVENARLDYATLKVN